MKDPSLICHITPFPIPSQFVHPSFHPSFFLLSSFLLLLLLLLRVLQRLLRFPDNLFYLFPFPPSSSIIPMLFVLMISNNFHYHKFVTDFYLIVKLVFNFLFILLNIDPIFKKRQ